MVLKVTVPTKTVDASQYAWHGACAPAHVQAAACVALAIRKRTEAQRIFMAAIINCDIRRDHFAY